LTGKYIRIWDDILLISKAIEVYDIYFNEDTNKIMIKYFDEHRDKGEATLDYLTNFVRTEKEKRHVKFPKAR